MSEEIEKLENLGFEIINSAGAPSVFVDGITSVIDSGDIIKISFFEDVSSGDVGKPSLRRVNLHLSFTENEFKKFAKHLNDILRLREAGSDSEMPEAGQADVESR